LRGAAKSQMSITHGRVNIKADQRSAQKDEEKIRGALDMIVDEEDRSGKGGQGIGHHRPRYQRNKKQRFLFWTTTPTTIVVTVH
jgi:hypothetical protein